MEGHHNQSSGDFHYEPEELTEDVEDLDGYRIGGYHPIELHNCLRGRYRIIHKLGFGSYAVVWLAWDLVLGKNVAVKVSTANDDFSGESRVLMALKRAHDVQDPVAGLERPNLSWILDEFDVNGPNGTHRCLVTAAARSSLLDAREWSSSGIFQLPVARAIVAQLARAVAFLHKNGVVHGDLHPGNVLLQLPRSMEAMPTDDLYAEFGQPQRLVINRSDGGPLSENVPSYAVVRARIIARCEDVGLGEAQIVLSDFGESFMPATTTRMELQAPNMFQPPEHLVQPLALVSFPSDIWALACAMFVILGQVNLFEPFHGTDEECLIDQIDALGPLPPELFSLWENRYCFFDEEQNPINRGEDGPNDSIAARIHALIMQRRQEHDYGHLGADEVQALETLLRSMLSMKAEDRISAREVMKSEWMVNWALPDLERAQVLWESDNGVEASDSA